MRTWAGERRLWESCTAACAALLLAVGAGATRPAQAAEPATPATQETQLSAAVRKQLAEQAEQMRVLRAELAQQKAHIERQDQRIDALQRALVAQGKGGATRDNVAGTVAPVPMHAAAAPSESPADMQPTPGAGGSAARAPPEEVARQPVGVAPASDTRPPAVAPLFDQPGVLTPRGKFVVEPSYQYGYSSSDRVALIGYTIIPALLIGLIDVRRVRISTQVAQLTFRYGITNRMEVEVRVPYVFGHTDTVSREIFTGSATDRVFTTSGNGIGDAEATLRYQFNDGGADRPYYVGWLRYKSRTGRDPFEVVTDCVQRCIQNATGTGLPLEMATGSGFDSIQPGLTWLFPSDPVVFFGNVSYLYNLTRDDVSLTLVGGDKQFLGDVKAGDIFDINVGVGLALNDKASLSFGYDQAFVGATEANGKTVPGSTRIVLGTLSVGGSYTFSPQRTLNVALGVGVTRDTPDVTLTVRMPMTF